MKHRVTALNNTEVFSMSLEKKKIVLGITGGIAAFKAASIASQLRKQGAEVKCIMTDHATKLITPLTMREISGNPVAVSMFDDVPEFNVEHIALARWADVFVIAPATADIIGKIANGIADDMLSTTVMATTAPVLIAPAMNTNMYLNPITQDNMAKLKKFGYHFIEPDSGHLACGIDGVGRLPEPDTIVDYIELLACRNDLLKGKKVLVTAGGTREPIDPVRFIGNHSSGRMTSTYKLVLNGIAVTAGLHALQILLIVGLDPTRFQQINTWLIGSIFGNSWTHVDILFLVVLLITFFFLASHETLDLLALREENALGLGIRVNRTRFLFLMAAVVLASSCGGSIGFIGLICPHIARRLVGVAHKRYLPVTALLGGVLLVAADYTARVIIAPDEILVGLIVSLIGAPYFLYILVRSRG